MFRVVWHLSVALRGYLRFYMPTNRVVDRLCAPHGLEWAIPVALLATPAYLFAMSMAAVGAEQPGLGWLNILVVLFFCYAESQVMPT